jgi:hypothetical protein
MPQTCDLGRQTVQNATRPVIGFTVRWIMSGSRQVDCTSERLFEGSDFPVEADFLLNVARQILDVPFDIYLGKYGFCRTRECCLDMKVAHRSGEYTQDSRRLLQRLFFGLFYTPNSKYTEDNRHQIPGRAHKLQILKSLTHKPSVSPL